MSRIFPRPIESAVRTLKKICDDPTNPIALRARSAEVILNAYGLAAIPPDSEPRHRTVKQIVAVRVKVSELDKEISNRVSEERKQKKLNKQIDELLRKESK
jgi:hypothetical protein